jgi:WD40 repeat protein
MTPTNVPAGEPFLGLRPFEEEDQGLFCGRGSHVDDVLTRLDSHRFVAIVGLSGSGKSSLVKAGVIPKLRADWLKNTSSHWLIALATPGAAPVERLSDSFVEAVRKYHEGRSQAMPASAEELRELIRSGSLGLRAAVEAARLPERMRVLLVVDQFEELFRYQQREKQDEAEMFVQELLEATADEVSEDGERRPSKIYVVITMRSEYLGECARYEGLAEAVNASLYLTPRLSRDQLKAAIVLPAAKCGGEVKIVNRLINAVADDQDQLPVLQHALMLCWELGNGVIDAKQYDEIGGADALGWHAENVLGKLGEEGSPQRKIAEKVFKRITKPGIKDSADQDGLRDPASLDEICRQIGHPREEVEPVIDVFRRWRPQARRAFLRPIEGEPLSGDSMIDITHESLIRKWKTLQGWVSSEAESAQAYARLLEEAGNAHAEDHLRLRDLALYEGFLDSGQWSEAWAERYGGDYRKAIEYVRRSRTYFENRDRQRRRQWILGAAAVVAIAAVTGFAVGFIIQRRTAQAIKETKAYSDLIERSLNQNDGMEQRGPAALAAFWLDSKLNHPGTLQEKLTLNDWELIDAVHAPGPNLGEKHDAKIDSRTIIDIGGVAIDPESKVVALADGHDVQAWSLGPRREAMAKIEFPGVTGVRLSADAKYLAAASGGELRIYALSSPRTPLKMWACDPGDSIVTMSFIAKTQKIAVLTQNGRLTVTSLEEGKAPASRQAAHAPGRPPLRSAQFCGTGEYLLVSFAGGYTAVTDVMSGRFRPIDRGIERARPGRDTGPGQVNAAAFTDDCSRIVTGSSTGLVRKTANPWLAADSSAWEFWLPRDEGVSQTQQVSTVTFGEQGWVAVGDYSGRAYAYRPDGPPPERYRASLHHGPVKSVRFANGTSTLITASGDRKAHVFDARTGIEQFRIPHDSDVVFATAIPSQKGGLTVLSAGQNTELHTTELPPFGRLRWREACSDGGANAGSDPTGPAVALLGNGDWVWPCRGEIQILSREPSAAPRKNVFHDLGTIVAMEGSARGSELTWIDRDASGAIRLNLATHLESTPKKRTFSLPKDWTFPPPHDWAASRLLAFSPDGRYVGAVLQDEARQWRVVVWASDRERPDIWEPSVPATEVRSLAVSNRGSVALGVASVLPKGDRNMVYACDSKACAPIPRPGTNGHPDQSNLPSVQAITFTPDGKSLLRATGDSQIQLIPLDDAAWPPPWDNVPASHFAWSSADDLLAAVELQQGHVTLFQLTEKGFQRLTAIREPGPIHDVALPNDTVMVSSVYAPWSDKPLLRIEHDIRVEELEKHTCAFARNDHVLSDFTDVYWKKQKLGAPPAVCGAPK